MTKKNPNNKTVNKPNKNQSQTKNNQNKKK